LPRGDDVILIDLGFEGSPVEDFDRGRPAFLDRAKEIDIEELPKPVLRIKELVSLLVIYAEDVEARMEVELEAVQSVELGRDRDAGPGREEELFRLEIHVQVIALDVVDAGVGDKVLVVQEGSSARKIFDDPWIPVQAVIVGVLDRVDIKGKQVL
jgi:hypothetical protein